MRPITGEWVDKAEADLITAERELRARHAAHGLAGGVDAQRVDLVPGHDPSDHPVQAMFRERVGPGLGVTGGAGKAEVAEPPRLDRPVARGVLDTIAREQPQPAAGLVYRKDARQPGREVSRVQPIA